MSTSPWRRHRALALLVEAWPEFEAEIPPPRDFLARLLDRSSSPWALASQAEASAFESYEAAVAAGKIPTREGSWHDTFNVLAFLTFPRSKAALHRRCLELQRARARKPPRSREEDALTLIDETAIVIAGPREALEPFERARGACPRDHDAPDERDAGALERLDQLVRAGGLQVQVLGHALLEHLALDRPRIGAGVLTVELDSVGDRSVVDATLAERIAAGGFPRPSLSPTLPWPDPTIESWLVAPTEPNFELPPATPQRRVGALW